MMLMCMHHAFCSDHVHYVVVVLHCQRKKAGDANADPQRPRGTSLKSPFLKSIREIDLMPYDNSTRSGWYRDCL
jgi:hypothetical protein